MGLGLDFALIFAPHGAKNFQRELESLPAEFEILMEKKT